MHKKLTLLFGIILTAVTLTNFVPGASSNHNGVKLLFGIFEVGGLLLALHLTAGLAALATATFTRYSRAYLKLFGAIFATAAIAGFVQGDSVFGVISVNTADNLLHSFFATALLVTGFWLKD